MSEKVNIKFPGMEKQLIRYKGQDVLVEPYITISAQTQLIREYFAFLFDDLGNDLPARYIIAEHALILGIINYQTNIELDNVDADQLFASDLWGAVRKEILNYESFRQKLDNAIKFYQKELALEKSVGTVLEDISAKVIAFVDKISNMNTDDIKNISGELAEQVDKLGKTLQADKPVAPKKRGRKSAKTS